VVVTGADDADVDADADVVLLLLGDGLLLQALATPSVSTARAAVPYLAVRHRLPVNPFVGLTCSYLLTSKSCDDRPARWPRYRPLTQLAIPVNYWAIPVKC
jgi:hypothetical protein